MYTDLYWNLQWYTTLWKLPANPVCGNLTADSPNIAAPIVCGWRRSVVEARVAKSCAQTNRVLLIVAYKTSSAPTHGTTSYQWVNDNTGAIAWVNANKCSSLASSFACMAVSQLNMLTDAQNSVLGTMSLIPAVFWDIFFWY